MDAVFYFTFYNYDTMHGPRSLAFYITSAAHTWDEIMNPAANCVKDLEDKYGDHSWGSWQSGVNTLVYRSDQVEGVEQQDELMEAWRHAFLDHSPPCAVGEVCAVDIDNMDDAQILNVVKSAYEHQQAQQLRATLVEHVNGTTSVGVCKKM